MIFSCNGKMYYNFSPLGINLKKFSKNCKKSVDKFVKCVTMLAVDEIEC